MQTQRTDIAFDTLVRVRRTIDATVQRGTMRGQTANARSPASVKKSKAPK